MKFEELSRRLKGALELEDSPVGVKLIKLSEELPEIAERAVRVESPGSCGRDFRKDR